MNPSISIRYRNERIGKTKFLEHPISYDSIPERSFDIKNEWAKEVELRPGLKLIITDLTFPRLLMGPLKPVTTVSAS
jgi:hypothetical protein